MDDELESLKQALNPMKQISKINFIKGMMDLKFYNLFVLQILFIADALRYKQMQFLPVIIHGIKLNQ